MSARNQPPPQLEKSFSFNYGTLNSVLKILAVNSIFFKISEHGKNTGGKVLTYESQVRRHFIMKLLNTCFKGEYIFFDLEV